MVVDMTKKQAEQPKVEEAMEESKEQLFNVSLTREEIETIKNALANSENFKVFLKSIEGSKENKILSDLESI